MAKCIRCRQGFDWECENDPKCVNVPTVASGTSRDNELDLSSSEENRKVNKHNDRNLKDPQSTGRKRAAVEFPINPEMDCEWKMRKNCGGGDKPITGCIAGKQQARHHGPDKNTLNNDVGNVHRICHTCHNRWHTENDENYDWGALHEFHSPVEATVEEIAMSEAMWIGRKTVKAKD